LKGEFDASLEASDSSFSRAVVHHVLGNTTEADDSLADLLENAHTYSLARVYGFRGDVDRTFAWLDALLENGDDYPTFILMDTAFRSVHSDPRWEALLEELGLLEFWLEISPGARADS
jgi:hypothetical protein